jgi:hypothetical protein
MRGGQPGTAEQRFSHARAFPRPQFGNESAVALGFGFTAEVANSGRERGLFDIFS